VTSGATDAPLVLFVCRHGAAKSVLAAAELDRLAKVAGVRVDVRAAGIEPDETIAPAVLAVLPGDARRNMPRPRTVTANDVAEASRTITFDIAASDLPGLPSAWDRWDGLPSAGDDPVGYIAALTPHVEALVHRLADAPADGPAQVESSATSTTRPWT
jgi:arsenate reductase (thioredoxin)